MKALVYEKAHALDRFAIELREVAEPTLREHDVLVEVHAIGVNPGEAFIRGVRSAEPGGRVLLGWEFGGVVIATGSSVRGFSIGDRVFGTGDMTRDGCWAERVAVDHRIIAKIPERLSFVDAASLPVGAITAWEAMFRDQPELPIGIERALIIGGAGAVGSLATQLLKARTKVFVIATASRAPSREWCSEMGADLVVDHTGDVAAQLAAASITNIDIVLSTAGSAGNMGWIAKVLRPFGHVSVVDLAAGLDVSPLAAKSASLHTEMIFSRVTHGSDLSTQGHVLDTVAALVVEGRVRPIATKQLDGLTAKTMKSAHGLVETKRTIGKVVIAT
jgi:NADPH2:quinone reductase